MGEKRTLRRTPLQRDLLRMDELKGQIAACNDEFKSIEERVMLQLDDMEGASTQVPVGSRILKATLSGSDTTVVIDEVGLKKKLGARMWDRVTTKVLDKKRLDELVKAQEVDINVVAQCSTQKPRKRYVKLTWT